MSGGEVGFPEERLGSLPLSLVLARALSLSRSLSLPLSSAHAVSLSRALALSVFLSLFHKDVHVPSAAERREGPCCSMKPPGSLVPKAGSFSTPGVTASAPA